MIQNNLLSHLFLLRLYGNFRLSYVERAPLDKDKTSFKFQLNIVYYLW